MMSKPISSITLQLLEYYALIQRQHCEQGMVTRAQTDIILLELVYVFF